MGRRSNFRLIKGYGNDFMAAEIADIPNLDHEIPTRLPLNVQCLIHRIGKFVRAVVVAEREKRIAVELVAAFGRTSLWGYPMAAAREWFPRGLRSQRRDRTQKLEDRKTANLPTGEFGSPQTALP